MNTYYVYLLTNPKRTVLYTGVTNDLARRLEEHIEHENGRRTFAGRYFCNLLVHWEEFHDINQAIAREKEIKGWRREKKDALVAINNPEWKELNGLIFGDI
ncbi:GIY-YIG nuclease family protein [Hymenobacter sp. DH14]|uniref:GIY-YIG nuclease family protein n=2 Tax=Hymenobacter cyanobacteriorum TaxID=2926463 RepID=A0A9X2AF73_9BACT|nr:GIY-YIG nuclease family protein [Hymenobacter cyanobacteriorum]MCI1187552.1 GIY-YIG nuclease family protein [Hymenobacter cyanobacteriorum]